jgi:hypothetical protein
LLEPRIRLERKRKKYNKPSEKGHYLSKKEEK